MAKIPEKHLQIGDKVIVNATVTFGPDQDYDESLKPSGPLYRRMFRDEITPTEMIIVGGAFRKTGIIHKTKHTYLFDGHEVDPGYLEVQEVIFVYHVRCGFTRKIQEALPEDIEVTRQAGQERISKKLGEVLDEAGMDQLGEQIDAEFGPIDMEDYRLYKN